MKPVLLLIDDDIEFSSDFSMLLSEHFECKTAENGKNGLEILKNNSIDIVLLDLMLKEGPNGISILKEIKSLEPFLPVFMVTDYSSVNTAIEAMKYGAYDYISKTPNLNELLIKIKRSIEESSLKLKARTLQSESSKNFYKIIGNSKAVQILNEKINLFANNENTVLITGESGVGKELVARQIHLRSDIKSEPFIALNCAAIPDNLLESELFGYEKGAFTGAIKAKPGKFEIASPGTIFLDEISELNFDAQVKLLRVIQNKEFERIGGTKVLKSRARIIAATNRDLEKLKDDGKFREDLFYRLDVLPIFVPPLRERTEDIPELVEYFSQNTCNELKINRKTFSKDSLSIMKEYNWPGNIRELQNHITRAIISSSNSVINPDDLDSKLTQNLSGINYSFDKIPETWEEMNQLRNEAADKVSREIEKTFLNNLLKKFDGNISQAANHIGLNRSSLYKMLKKCEIIK